MFVNFLQAFNGDSIWINFQDSSGANRNILIDGGPGNAYQIKNKKGKQEAGNLQMLINDLKEKGQNIDLLILTHVDYDHIGGLLKWFAKDENAKRLIKNVWFNSGRLIAEHFNQNNIEENELVLIDETSFDTSIRQGVKFEDFLEEHGLWEKRLIKAGDELEIFGLKITIISPSESKLNDLLVKWEKEAPITDTSSKDDYHLTIKEHIAKDSFKEDKSIHNGSSIGFILEYNGKSAVFLGDAHPVQVTKSLNSLGYSKESPLQAEFLKVSHHGSKANTNYELLGLINTDSYIISSNGDKHELPDKQCLARIINHNNNAQVYFNYPEKIKQIFSGQDYKDFPGFKVLSAEEGFAL